MKEDVLFKKTPFGGFDRVEVITYIQRLKETQHKYKLMIDDKENVNRKLSAEKEELEGRIEALEKALENERERADAAEKNVKELNRKCDELEKKALSPANKKAAKETVKMCDELVDTASDTAKKIVAQAEAERDEIQAKIAETVDKIEKAKKMPAKEIKELISKLAEELKNG